MVRIHNPENYDLLGIEVNKGKRSKYDGVLQNKITRQIKRIPFGQKGFDQFEDQVGHYSQFDHKDIKRRHNWLKRHERNTGYKFSSAWFAKTYLW